MLFCMRVMVGVIILYDHVHPVGAFAKTSKIDVSENRHSSPELDLSSFNTFINKILYAPDSKKCWDAP